MRFNFNTISYIKSHFKTFKIISLHKVLKFLLKGKTQKICIIIINMWMTHVITSIFHFSRDIQICNVSHFWFFWNTNPTCIRSPPYPMHNNFFFCKICLKLWCWRSFSVLISVVFELFGLNHREGKPPPPPSW